MVVVLIVDVVSGLDFVDEGFVIEVAARVVAIVVLLLCDLLSYHDCVVCSRAW